MVADLTLLADDIVHGSRSDIVNSLGRRLYEGIVNQHIDLAIDVDYTMFDGIILGPMT